MKWKTCKYYIAPTHSWDVRGRCSWVLDKADVDTTIPNRFTKYGTTIYFEDIVYRDSEFFRASDKSPIPKGTSIKEMIGMKESEE